MSAYIPTHIDWFNYTVLKEVLKDKSENGRDTRNLLIKCLTETDKHNKYAIPLARLFLSLARGIPPDWFILPNGNNCGLICPHRTGIGLIWDTARMNLVGAIHLMNGVEIDSITIVPAYQRKGIATRIIASIAQYASAFNYPIYAMVSRNALPAFKSAGFLNEGIPLDDGTFFHYAQHNKSIHKCFTAHSKDIVPINLGDDNTKKWVDFLYFRIPILIKNLNIPGAEIGEPMNPADKDNYFIHKLVLTTEPECSREIDDETLISA